MERRCDESREPEGSPARHLAQVLLLAGAAVALGGIIIIRYEQVPRYSRAIPRGSWEPGIWFVIAGLVLVIGAVILHSRLRRRGLRGIEIARTPAVPLALDFFGLIFLVCAGGWLGPP